MGNNVRWSVCTSELATVGQASLFYGGGFTQLSVQTLGVVSSGLYAFLVAFIILKVMDKVVGGLRVSKEEEMVGLVLSEHGGYGYPANIPQSYDLSNA
ncbi:hypothetical protein [Lentibacillus salicampi]|uniref:hypothetical protein n=1 Tax=Lentibacillus salicampi TaxID=175306 RepID=UPI003CC90986